MSFSFGSDLNAKLKNAIKMRLSEMNAYVDDELPDYVLVMIANRRSKETMHSDLKLFLGSNTVSFIDWLYDLLERMQLPGAESSTHETDQDKSSSRRNDKKSRRKSDSADEGKRHTSTSKSSSQHHNVDTAVDRDEFAEELDHFKQSESSKGQPSKTGSTSKSHSHHSRQSDKAPSGKSSHPRSPHSSPRRHHSQSLEQDTSRVREARVAPMPMSESSSQPLESIVKVPARPRLELGNYALIQRALREATADSQQMSALRQAGRSRLGEEKPSSGEKMDVDSSSVAVDPNKVVRSNPIKRKATDPKSDNTRTTFVVTMNATPAEIENKRIAENSTSSSIRTAKDQHGLRTIIVEKAVDRELSSQTKDADDNASLEDTPPVYKRVKCSSTSEVAGELEEMETLDEMSSGKLEPGSIKERCKYWPLCRNDRICPYLHPTEPCKAFPNCAFGNKCYYIHPPCRFQAQCANNQCPYLHTTYRNPYPSPRPYSQSSYYNRPTFSPRVFGPTSMSMGRFHLPPQLNEPSQTGVRCKFYPHCSNPRCPFWHPSPKGGSLSLHKWVSPHLDQPAGNVNRQASVDTTNSVSDMSVM